MIIAKLGFILKKSLVLKDEEQRRQIRFNYIYFNESSCF